MSSIHIQTDVIPGVTYNNEEKGGDVDMKRKTSDTSDVVQCSTLDMRHIVCIVAIMNYDTVV